MRNNVIIRVSNGVSLGKVFSASLKGGCRGFIGAVAAETFSNTVTPAVRTLSNFLVVSVFLET